MTKLIHRIKKVDYHRNGVGGAGFYEVLFEMKDEDNPDKIRNMVATWFINPECYGADDEDVWFATFSPLCAVYDVDALSDGTDNCWRGDNFEEEVRQAVREYNKRT
jgi:hypothetical protein